QLRQNLVLRVFVRGSNSAHATDHGGGGWGERPRQPIGCRHRLPTFLLARGRVLLLWKSASSFIFMPANKPTWRNPWAWVSTLYLAEGLPYVVVMTVAVVMYKGLGISNTEIALWTSWLYLPWVIKPLWSPIVDILGTRRRWIWLVQLVLGAGLAGVALTLHASNVFRYSLAFLWLLAFSSATHDIAIDGFYLLATTEKEQAFFVG